MNSFLYYLPGRKLVVGDDVPALPCAYAFDGPYLHSTEVHQGPDGQGGAVIAPSDRCEAAHCIYRTSDQTWIEAAGYWVGYWNDRRPREEDLRRPSAIEGDWVSLGDDHAWIVPRARRWSAAESGSAAKIEWTNLLPSRVRFAGGVAVLGDPLPRYAELWSIANAVAAVRFGQATVEQEKLVSWENIFHIVCRVLAVNYAISPIEATLLDLLTTETPTDVLDAVLDWDTFTAWQKKTSRPTAGASSSNGAEGS
jgi:hypothetical protein